MLLLLVNYKNEIDYDFFSQYKFLDIKILNEKKGNIFGLKLLKLLIENKNKYDMVLHFGLCGAKDPSFVGNIYKIDRTFLFYQDIIDNQRFKNGKFGFDTIPNLNIVTKFKIDENPAKLYDFAEIFDLETFWVSQISNQTLTPIFGIKGVSDANDIFGKENFVEELKYNIQKVNLNLKQFWEEEFLDFYKLFIENKDFRKKFYI